MRANLAAVFRKRLFFPSDCFSKADSGNGKRDAKSKKLMLPENSFLPLERMKRDVGEEVSKEPLVSRKPLHFHASFSKGTWGSFHPDGQMNIRSGVGCESVLLLKSVPLTPSLRGREPPGRDAPAGAAGKELVQHRVAGKQRLSSRRLSLAGRARGRASGFVSELPETTSPARFWSRN